MNQRVTLSNDEAMDIVIRRAEAAAEELAREGFARAENRPESAMVLNLAVAQLRILGGRGLLSTEDLEKALAARLGSADLEIENTRLPDIPPIEVSAPVAEFDPRLEFDQSIDVEVTMSEIGGKLELARAYVEMGDPEGARKILTEVLHEEEAAKDEIVQIQRQLVKQTT